MEKSEKSQEQSCDSSERPLKFGSVMEFEVQKEQMEVTAEGKAAEAGKEV